MLAFLRERFGRFFFGDDVFISYSRTDADLYAARLGEELKRRKLSVKIDQWGSTPNPDVPPEILRAAGRSGVLVVIGTVTAGRSPNIRREIEAFLPSGRNSVPVDLDGSLRLADWWLLLDGVAVSREHQGSPGRQPERVSPDIVDRIVSSLTVTRKNFRLLQAAVAAVALIGIVSAVATWQAARAAIYAQDAAQKAAQKIEAERRRDAALVSQTEAERRRAAALASQQAAERVAESRRIAASLDDYGQQNLELAIKAVELSPTSEAIEALRSGCAT